VNVARISSAALAKCVVKNVCQLPVTAHSMIARKIRDIYLIYADGISLHMNQLTGVSLNEVFRP